jgi:hypothetical protein
MKRIALCIALAAPCAAFGQQAYINDIRASAEARATEYERLTADQVARDAQLAAIHAQVQASHALIAGFNQIFADIKASSAAADAAAAKRHAELLAAIAALPKAAALTAEQIAAMLRVAPAVP